MNVFWITVYLLGAYPITQERDYSYRAELAEAIAEVTDDEWEQRQLARIAVYESLLLPSVGRCAKRGDGGLALGPYQIHARSGREYRDTCASLVEASKIALERVYESLAMCKHLKPKWQLSGYTSGNCEHGHAEAERRYVARELPNEHEALLNH